jgi:predicted amidophosphoribosyltransferase
MVSLQRVASSSTQTRKSRYERWKNIEGTFHVTDPASVREKHILLVDDVITTGSTMESCVTELLKQEGVRVSAVALAVSVL